MVFSNNHSVEAQHGCTFSISSTGWDERPLLPAGSDNASIVLERVARTSFAASGLGRSVGRSVAVPLY